MRYTVILIHPDIKTGQVVPFGATRRVVVKNTDSRDKAIKEAKKRVGKSWKVMSATKSHGQLDPDARVGR